MRITEDEIRTIKQVFKDNDALLKLLRKIFLPEYDPKAPIAQTVDLWSVKDISSMTPEECKIYFLARKDLIMHVEAQIQQLKLLADMKTETKEEKESRLRKDSLK